jgi:serine/threonine-protein kinase
VVPAPAEIGEAENLEPGSLVSNRYRVLNLLGEGAMGAVYRVEHVHIRKTFVLKVLHGNRSSSPEIVARFEREAVAAGNINHRNVAAATDFGKLADGSFFLVLEFVAGRSLRVDRGRHSSRGAHRDHAGASLRCCGGQKESCTGTSSQHRNLDRDGNPDFVKVLDFGSPKVGNSVSPCGRRHGRSPG